MPYYFCRFFLCRNTFSDQIVPVVFYNLIQTIFSWEIVSFCLMTGCIIRMKVLCHDNLSYSIVNLYKYLYDISHTALSMQHLLVTRAWELQYPICPLDGNKVKTFGQVTDGIKCTSMYAHVLLYHGTSIQRLRTSLKACLKHRYRDLIRTGLKAALLLL